MPSNQHDRVGAGVLKRALKYFLMTFGPKIFGGLFLTYMQEKSVILATPRPAILLYVPLDLEKQKYIFLVLQVQVFKTKYAHLIDIVLQVQKYLEVQVFLVLQKYLEKYQK